MNMSFYTAGVGAQQQQSRLNIHGNNIANVNNDGFKAKKPSFAALMYQNVQGIDQAELPRGSGAHMIMAETDFRPGTLADTGKPQDYAISGKGFFALQDPSTGEISFTRSGSFSLSSRQEPNADGVLEPTWYLADGHGRFVLSNEGTRIKVTDASARQPVGIFDFVNANGMQNAGENRFLPIDKNGDVRLGTGKLMYGVLETSNTDLAYEMAKVIEAQRTYSFSLRMVQTSDELETTVNNLRG